jgi:hypothetical protein
MPRNVGRIDRTVRVIVGLVLLALAFVGPQTFWGYIGLLPLITGIAGYCPLYQALRISTNPKTRQQAATRAV